MEDITDTSSEDRLSVADAAKLLGLTEDAIRKRIHRGQIKYEQDSNGRYWVYLNPTNQTVKTDIRTDSPQDLTRQHLDFQIRDMQEEIRFLRRKLDESDEANKENRRIIAALTQRIPAIEAPAADSTEPSDEPESTISDSETEAKGAVPQDQAEAEIRKSWWRRLLGG